MDKESLAIVYALISMVAFGLSNGIMKDYVRKYGSTQIIVYRNVVAIPVIFIAVLLFRDQQNFSPKHVILSILLACITYFALYFYMKALSNGKVGIVSPISNLRAIIASIIGVTFLQDTLNLPQGMSILAIVFATSLISLDFKNLKNSQILNIKSGIAYSFLAALIWGFTIPFFSPLAAKLGAFLFAFLLEGTVLLMSSSQTLLKRENLLPPKKDLRKDWLPLVFTGLLVGIGSIFINLGFSTGRIGIVAAVGGSSPLIATIYAGIIYKERLHKKHYLAILIIIIGIFALSYFGN